MGPRRRRDDVEEMARMPHNVVIREPGARPSMDCCSRFNVIAHASCFGPSVIAARKSLYVSGRFRALALVQGEGGGSAERRNLVTAAACFPDRRETEAHGNASRRSTGGVLRPWSALPGTWILAAISRRPPVPVQPASVADPFRGRTDTQGLPRTASHVSSPPQAPLPSPRSKASYRNAPSCGIGCLGL